MRDPGPGATCTKGVMTVVNLESQDCQRSYVSVMSLPGAAKAIK